VTNDALEVSDLARRLAFKLGCARVALIATVEPRFYVHLCGLVPVTGIDAPTRIGRARLVSPDDDWRVHESAVGGEWQLDGIELDATVLLVGAHELVDAETRAQLADAMERAPASIIVGDDVLRGSTILNELADSARAAGLAVEAATLVTGPDGVRDCPLLVVTNGTEARVGAVVRGGLNSLAFDPEFDAFDAPVSEGRILVASYEVVGPTLTGGIGTANTALALALAEAGHDVTLLYTGFESNSVRNRLPRWADFYRARGLRFESLGEFPLWHETSPHFNVARSFQLYKWLLTKKRFDVVHVPECQGHGYFAQLAKRQSGIFGQTSFVVGIHSSTRWCAEANRRTLGRLEHLVDDELERRSVELADVLISPSAYLLDNTRRRGWKTPARSFVQQYIVRETSTDHPGADSARRPTEIVYFGRIETRKGAELFCDAIDELATSTADRDLEVTFLGTSGIIGTQAGETYVADRARHWPWPHSIRTSYDRHEAIEYLRSRNCIAVMPSLVDNLPNTVIEAISLGIPFIASRSGGTAELIALDDLERCTFDPLVGFTPGVEPPTHSDTGKDMSHADLVEKLRRALSEGHALARFAVDPTESLGLHAAWNGSESHRARTSASLPERASDVTVAFAVAGDASDIESIRHTVGSAVLAGLESQGVVVLMGDVDGSDQTELAYLEAECATLGWQLVRQAPSHVAQAHNRALEDTTASLIVFLLPGVALIPESEEKIRAALGDASALTFTALRGTSDGKERWAVPLAGPAVAGLRYDAFSVGAYAVTRRAIERVGGFTPDATGREADTDVLARLQLAGCRVDQLVEPVVHVVSPSLQEKLVRRFAHVEGHPGHGDSASLLVERAFRRAMSGPLVDAVSLIGAGADPDWASGIQGQLVAAQQHSEGLERSRALRVARMIRRVQARVGLTSR